MAENSTIRITLDSLEELFDEPEADPWDPDSRFRSGIDELLAKLRLLPPREAVDIVIEVSGQTVTPEFEPRTRQAIATYCDAHLEATRDEKMALHGSGRRDFIISVVVVAVLILVVSVLIAGFQLDGILRSALVGWTGIAAWAILWNPVDTFVWGRLPLRREIALLERLKSIPVAVRQA